MRVKGWFSGLPALCILVLAVGPTVVPARGAVRDWDETWRLTASRVARWLEKVETLPPDSEGAAGDRVATWPLGIAWGQGRLFGMPQLPQTSLTVQARQGSWVLGGRWEQLGADLVRERLLGATLGRQGRWTLAADVRQRTLAIKGESSLVRQWFVLSLGRRLAGPGDCSLEWEGHVPLGSVGEVQPTPLLDLRVWHGTTAVAAHVDRRPGGAPALDLDVYWKLADGAALDIRLDPGSGAMGPGLHLRRGRLLVRTSHLAHPRLGVTHRVGCWVGVGHG